MKYGRKKQGKTGNEAFWPEGGLLIISAVLQVLARKTGWFRTMGMHSGFIPGFQGLLARFFGLFPFPVGELLLYFLLISCVLYGFCHLGQWEKIVSGTLFLISLLFCLYGQLRN